LLIVASNRSLWSLTYIEFDWTRSSADSVHIKAVVHKSI